MTYSLYASMGDRVPILLQLVSQSVCWPLLLQVSMYSPFSVATIITFFTINSRQCLRTRHSDLPFIQQLSWYTYTTRWLDTIFNKHSMRSTIQDHNFGLILHCHHVVQILCWYTKNTICRWTWRLETTDQCTYQDISLNVRSVNAKLRWIFKLSWMHFYLVCKYKKKKMFGWLLSVKKVEPIKLFPQMQVDQTFSPIYLHVYKHYATEETWHSNPKDHESLTEPDLFYHFDFLEWSSSLGNYQNHECSWVQVKMCEM